MEDLMTNAVHAETALLPEGWVANVRLTLEGGRIASVENGVAPGIADERHAVLVPAMPNLHSHAFQRAMAGLAAKRGPGSDHFWSWRDRMYRFELSLTPEQMQAVAAQTSMEMMAAGIGRVGEFPHLPHGRGAWRGKGGKAH